MAKLTTAIYPSNPQKGRIEVYNPTTRQIDSESELNFQFIPTEVSVKYNPNFEFLTAPQGLRNFAQFGSTKPRVISFSLTFIGNVNSFEDKMYIAEVQNKLKALVNPYYITKASVLKDSAVNIQNIRLAPPLVRLIMGNIVQGSNGDYPIGVISSLDIKSQSVDNVLNLNRFEAGIEFTESTTDYGLSYNEAIYKKETGIK